MVAVMAMSSCAPQFKTAGGPITQAMLGNDGLTMPDGFTLPLRKWQAGNANAVVIGVHGMGDYSNAFDGIAGWLSQKGVTTYAFDQRGFGTTTTRGYWPGTQTMVGDLKHVVSLVREKHPNQPLYIIGLSMGAAVAMATMADEDAPQIDGLILAAPGVWGWTALNPLYKATLWIGAHTMPWKKLTGGRLKIWPSDNIEMLRAYSADPNVIKGTRIDAVYGLVSLMEAGYQAAPKIQVPTLIVYGNKDEIIPPEPVNYVIETVPGPKRVALYEDGYHMLLRDLQREIVWADIQSWLSDRAKPLPSGAEITEFNAEARKDQLTGPSAIRVGEAG